MEVDDVFVKPGAVPFKWEIQPGVPKVQQPQPQPTNHYHRSFPSPTPKLRPPPSESYFIPPPELRTRSFRSAPSSRSDRWRFDQTILAGPMSTVSSGCFPNALLRRKDDKKRAIKKSEPESESESEPGFVLDLETLARWSMSGRKTLSRFQYSPSSSSSSQDESPRPVSSAEWAGFGLF